MFIVFVFERVSLFCYKSVVIFLLRNILTQDSICRIGEGITLSLLRHQYGSRRLCGRRKPCKRLKGIQRLKGIRRESTPRKKIMAESI
jgi:hypothetical protein